MLVSINLLVLAVIILLSMFFYNQFQQALDERVLLQLTSIMNLKRIQIEDYFHNDSTDSWVKLSEVPDLNCFQQNTGLTGKGVYDLLPCSDQRTHLLAKVRYQDADAEIRWLRKDRIQNILLKRTGMGESGETYLVAADKTMRSASRFFPDQDPLSIVADTEGVNQALSGSNGSGIILDYRGVPVYSAYHLLDIPDLNWVILSEIDVAEAALPLTEMRNKLILITVVVSLLAIALSLVITRVLTEPLFKMRDLLRGMSAGDYDLTVDTGYTAREIQEMFKALDELKQSMAEAIRFSVDVGNMDLDAHYELASKHDKLGKSLIQMREKLAEYERKERAAQQLAKKSLITGQESERQRLARELHDGLGPLLTSLKLTMQSLDLPAETRNKTNTVLDHTIAEIRRMTYDLMPPALTDFGVGKALFHFLELIRQSSDLEIHYEDCTKSEGSKITPEMNICLFRVCQELVHNALKHSGASKMALTLTEFNHKISVYYMDNGRGFDVEETTQGSGLKNIRERIAVFDGYLHIASSNQGTEVEIEISFNE
jgi:signal transduction histidine kinase